jgi:hypothetical protein
MKRPLLFVARIARLSCLALVLLGFTRMANAQPTFTLQIQIIR